MSDELKRYTAIMITDDEGWSFIIPDLPGFAAQFDHDECPTFSSAILAAEAVLGDFTGVMIDDGMELPEPRDPGVVARDPTVTRDRETGDAIVMLKAIPVAGEAQRVNISIDASTLVQVDRAAARLGLSRSAFLARAAREYA